MLLCLRVCMRACVRLWYRLCISVSRSVRSILLRLSSAHSDIISEIKYWKDLNAMSVFTLDCVHQLSDINDRIITDGRAILIIRLTGETKRHYSNGIKRIGSPACSCSLEACREQTEGGHQRSVGE
jgi:hypothetical protein